jgi:hypothetical protein
MTRSNTSWDFARWKKVMSVPMWEGAKEFRQWITEDMEVNAQTYPTNGEKNWSSWDTKLGSYCEEPHATQEI